MEKIKEFLLDSNATNLNVIITSVVTTAITGAAAVLLKKIYDILKPKCKKFYKWIKFKIIFLRRKGSIIKQIKYSRRHFYEICKKYEKDKSSYNLIIDNQLKRIKYLLPKEKKIRDKIINENKEKIEKETMRCKDILEKAERSINRNISTMIHNSIYMD